MHVPFASLIFFFLNDYWVGVYAAIIFHSKSFNGLFAFNRIFVVYSMKTNKRRKTWLDRTTEKRVTTDYFFLLFITPLNSHNTVSHKKKGISSNWVI